MGAGGVFRSLGHSHNNYMNLRDFFPKKICTPSPLKKKKKKVHLLKWNWHYLFKFNNGNTRTMCEICSKLTTSLTSLQCLYCWLGTISLWRVSIVDFEQIDAGWVSERGIRQQLGICWLTFGLDNKLTPYGLESSAQSKVPL